MNDELENIRKEAGMAYYEMLLWHLPGGSGENHKNLSQDSLSLSQDLNQGPPEYKAGVLTTRP
jgi:hypothetical protein